MWKLQFESAQQLQQKKTCFGKSFFVGAEIPFEAGFSRRCAQRFLTLSACGAVFWISRTVPAGAAAFF